MKYVVLLGDGMADDPQASLGGRTPLEAARTPALDRIAACGRIGLCRTVPEDMEPGSDVANLAILGYDPKTYYTGRAAIEAAALGLRLGPDEAAFRMNLVTLGGEEPDLVMDDYSAGHPTPAEQKAVMDVLAAELATGTVRLVPGVSFRNLCLVSGFSGRPELKPPHDYAGRPVRELLPAGPGSELLIDLQQRARKVLADHPVNRERRRSGQAPINGIWFWGMGRATRLPSFRERHGLTAAAVTGVDLIRGLARLLEMEIVPVPGATGYVDTNYEGKARAVLEALARVDFVFLHVEAPDEAGHEGNLELKVQAIEDFDQRAVRIILDGLQEFEDYKVLLLPDHETPVKERCHRGGLVPFAVASRSDLQKAPNPGPEFSEKAARQAGGSPVPAPLLLASRLFC